MADRMASFGSVSEWLCSGSYAPDMGGFGAGGGEGQREQLSPKILTNGASHVWPGRKGEIKPDHFAYLEGHLTQTHAIFKFFSWKNLQLPKKLFVLD